MLKENKGISLLDTTKVGEITQQLRENLLTLEYMKNRIEQESTKELKDFLDHHGSIKTSEQRKELKGVLKTYVQQVNRYSEQRKQITNMVRDTLITPLLDSDKEIQALNADLLNLAQLRIDRFDEEAIRQKQAALDAAAESERLRQAKLQREYDQFRHDLPYWRNMSTKEEIENFLGEYDTPEGHESRLSVVSEEAQPRCQIIQERHFDSARAFWRLKVSEGGLQVLRAKIEGFSDHLVTTYVKHRNGTEPRPGISVTALEESFREFMEQTLENKPKDVVGQAWSGFLSKKTNWLAKLSVELNAQMHKFDKLENPEVESLQLIFVPEAPKVSAEEAEDPPAAVTMGEVAEAVLSEESESPDVLKTREELYKRRLAHMQNNWRRVIIQVQDINPLLRDHPDALKPLESLLKRSALLRIFREKGYVPGLRLTFGDLDIVPPTETPD